MSRVAVVCHDAGGAEILSSWLLRSHDLCFVVAEGPAVGIFDRKCPDAERLCLTEAITRCDWVLCGTGASGFELQAIKLGRQQSKTTISFLDHWVNYKERFQDDDGSFTFPDEIWVGDNYSHSIAKEELPNLPITLQINPYLDDLRSEFLNIESNKPLRGKISILYLCEYVDNGNGTYVGYTEESALVYFLENIESLRLDIALITIRPHPSENLDKYKWAKALAPEIINFGGDKTLVQEIIDADVVVGCETMALVVGLLAGKRVISCIPPGGVPLRLPHAEIEKLQELI